VNAVTRALPGRGPLFRLAGLIVIPALVVLITGSSLAPRWSDPTAVEADGTCGKHYVAGADNVPAGDTIQVSQTYPSHLWNDHLLKQPSTWCMWNTSANGTTSSGYISGGPSASFCGNLSQLSCAWNFKPDFITLTLGEQNNNVVDLITTCFKDYRDPPHDFTSAQTCEQAILNNTSLWSNMSNDLIKIFNSYKQIMAGRPWLVVAVPNYPNPFPSSISAIGKVAELCQGTTDTITSCTIRWTNFPSALSTADQVIQKLNSTIQNAVQPFYVATQGRFIYVDVYTRFKNANQSMKMDVTLKLDQVCHLCGTEGEYIDNHSSEQNFGPDNSWFQAGDDGTATPFYLQPPDQINDPPVVLIQESQTTSGMGVYPNDTGNKCISDAIWEAVKWKLGVAEPVNNNICQ
jgi:hypothetical protein